jgi:hypothetical protein
MLDRVDELLADGTLALDPPNAATLQILTTVRTLDAFEDLSEHVRAHACAEPALAMFDAPPAQVPRFVNPEWLAPLAAAAAPS